MTDLERVSQYCDPYVKGVIDAHLKEDAAEHETLHQADRARVRAEAELAELREAVRQHFNNCIPGPRLRQLIEEKE